MSTMTTTTIDPLDAQIMRELVGQVARACPDGKTEQSVTTLITRPMWRAWCRAVGSPEDSEPTEWIGIRDTLRVYGSRTVVVESPVMAAVSFVGKMTA